MSISAYRNTMTEKALMETIQAAAKALGYLVYHPYDSRRSEPGWPDLFLVRNGAILVYETKTATGRVRPAQLDWLEELQHGRVLSARIVRPADLDDVLEELREAS